MLGAEDRRRRALQSFPALSERAAAAVSRAKDARASYYKQYIQFLRLRDNLPVLQKLRGTYQAPHLLFFLRL